MRIMYMSNGQSISCMQAMGGRRAAGKHHAGLAGKQMHALTSPCVDKRVPVLSISCLCKLLDAISDDGLAGSGMVSVLTACPGIEPSVAGYSAAIAIMKYHPYAVGVNCTLQQNTSFKSAHAVVKWQGEDAYIALDQCTDVLIISIAFCRLIQSYISRKAGSNACGEQRFQYVCRMVLDLPQCLHT